METYKCQWLSYVVLIVGDDVVGTFVHSTAIDEKKVVVDRRDDLKGNRSPLDLRGRRGREATRLRSAFPVPMLVVEVGVAVDVAKCFRVVPLRG